MSAAAVITFRPMYLEDLAIGTAEGQTDTVNILGAGPLPVHRITLASLAGSLVSAGTDQLAGAAGVRTGQVYLGPSNQLRVKGPDAVVVGTGNASQTVFTHTFANGADVVQAYSGGLLQNPSIVVTAGGLATATFPAAPGAGLLIIFVRVA